MDKNLLVWFSCPRVWSYAIVRVFILFEHYLSADIVLTAFQNFTALDQKNIRKALLCSTLSFGLACGMTFSILTSLELLFLAVLELGASLSFPHEEVLHKSQILYKSYYYYYYYYYFTSLDALLWNVKCRGVLENS